MQAAIAAVVATTSATDVRVMRDNRRSTSGQGDSDCAAPLISRAQPSASERPKRMSRPDESLTASIRTGHPRSSPASRNDATAELRLSLGMEKSRRHPRPATSHAVMFGRNSRLSGVSSSHPGTAYPGDSDQAAECRTRIRLACGALAVKTASLPKRFPSPRTRHPRSNPRY